LAKFGIAERRGGRHADCVAEFNAGNHAIILKTSGSGNWNIGTTKTGSLLLM